MAGEFRTTMNDLHTEIARLASAIERQTEVLEEMRDAEEATHRDLYIQQRVQLDLTNQLAGVVQVVEAMHKLVYQTHSGQQHIYLTETRGELA